MSERKVDLNGKARLNSPCGLLPKESWIHTPFYYIAITLNGKARVFDRLGKSFEGRAQAGGLYEEMTIQEAFDFVKRSSIYVWEHNDKAQLCEEYGLRKSTVKSYFNYSGYGLEDGPFPWNEE
jgi:hypothetical protein